MGVKLYLIVLLIFISLLNSDVDHLFVYQPVTSIPSLEKRLLKSFDTPPFFFNGLFVFIVALYEFFIFYFLILPHFSLPVSLRYN